MKNKYSKIEKYIVEKYSYMMYTQQEFADAWNSGKLSKSFAEQEFIVPCYAECSEGWMSLVKVLLDKIDGHINSNFSQQEWQFNNSKKGFWNFLKRLFKKQKDPVRMSFKIDQIKEKFGGLRFYYEGGDEYISGLISMAESFSYKICYFTGKPATKKTSPWILNVCDEEYDRIMKEKEKK